MLLLLLACIGFYTAGLVVYRLVFSPLATFPGPKIAAATHWYEFWYCIVKDGQFAFKLQELHRKYGPIIRVNPNELHVSDPEFFDAVYSPRYDKYEAHTNALIAPGSVMATPKYDDYKRRRQAVSPFFSRMAIERQLPMIRSKVTKLCRRFVEVAGTKEVVDLHHAFSALTRDIMSVMMYGKCYESLEHPEYAKQWSNGLEEGLKGTIYIRIFPMLRYLVYTIPTSWMVRMNGTMIYNLDCHKQVRQILHEEKTQSLQEKTSRRNIKPTIFHQILHSNLPESEVTADRIANEAFTLIGAGTETTAKALATIFFHLLNDCVVLSRLRAELETLPPPFGASRWRSEGEQDGIPPLPKLEALPYLSAVVKEGLRCANSVTTRLPRISQQPVPYHDSGTGKDWTIPPHTPIGMTNYDILVDPNIFPSPQTFDPSRWLERSQDGETMQIRKELNKYLVVFSRGSRMCLGVELVWAELYSTVWAVVQWLDLDLYETTERDVLTRRDYWTAHPAAGSKGIRATVRQVRC